MLQLVVKRGESVKCGDVLITPLESRFGSVRLGFTGPRETPIHRQAYFSPDERQAAAAIKKRADEEVRTTEPQRQALALRALLRRAVNCGVLADTQALAAVGAEVAQWIEVNVGRKESP